jgi:small GTP-binding protein
MIIAQGTQLKEAKVVMLGSSTVGKSSIVTMLTRGTFSETCASTIGAAFLSKTISINGNEVKLQIWDTGGSERYRAMAPMYFQNAQAAIIVYDITVQSTFQDVEQWIKDLKEKGPPQITIALAGNKCDLGDKRKVKTEEASRFAAKNGIKIFKETSALNGTNINAIFNDVADDLLNETTIEETATVKIDVPEENKEECSC